MSRKRLITGGRVGAMRHVMRRHGLEHFVVARIERTGDRKAKERQ